MLLVDLIYEPETSFLWDALFTGNEATDQSEGGRDDCKFAPNNEINSSIIRLIKS